MARRDVGERLRLLLAIIPWLVSVGGAPTAEVSERFGLTEDEVVELLELAACCGLPPYTPDQLMELIVYDGWVSANLGIALTRPQRLTPDEGFTLAASARAILAVQGADPEGSLARALEKLEGVLGARLAVELDDPPLLDVVRRAAEAGESLDITYYSESRDELTERRVDPHAVFVRDGHWYLDGWCALASGRRLFRVDRVRTAVAVPGPEVRPARPGGPLPGGPVPGGPVPETFVPGPEAPVVTMVVPADGRWVVESYPTLGAEEAGDGRLKVTLAVGGLAWLERLLLRLGPDAEVVDPPELADAGRRAASRLLGMYS
ncbi:MAG: helix-turn-helix transcriptional regulator [Acidimicrobiales bacterium]